MYRYSQPYNSAIPLVTHKQSNTQIARRHAFKNKTVEALHRYSLLWFVINLYSFLFFPWCIYTYCTTMTYNEKNSFSIVLCLTWYQSWSINSHSDPWLHLLLPLILLHSPPLPHPSYMLSLQSCLPKITFFGRCKYLHTCVVMIYFPSLMAHLLALPNFFMMVLMLSQKPVQPSSLGDVPTNLSWVVSSPPFHNPS